MKEHVGIVGFGVYLPNKIMTAKEVSQATEEKWSEDAVKEKLGFTKKYVADKEDGTQEMGVKASQDCLKNTGIDPLDIDMIICIGEEWKEYPLTTSAMYIQEKIGAYNAFGYDLSQRCCTTITAMKIAKDMILVNEDINTVLICGGYRNGDFIDYTNSRVSFMFNLSAGGGAVLLKKNYGRNELLETDIITDGSFARDVAVVYGGTENPINEENLDKAYKTLDVLDVVGMKKRLNEKSTPNFLKVIRESLRKSGYCQEDVDYIAMLHFKYSAHKYILNELGIDEQKSVYLKDYGHMGQIDQILSMKLAVEQGKIKDGDIVVTVGAGIGYAWAANTIRWGEVK